MDNSRAGQQPIEQIGEKPSWFRRGNPSHIADLIILLSCGLLLTQFIHIWSYWPGVGLDDGWIHLTFARNLTQNHLWSINPQGASGGATSILWVLILSAGFFITNNGPAIALTCNSLLMLTLALLVHRLWCDLAESSNGVGRIFKSTISSKFGENGGFKNPPYKEMSIGNRWSSIISKERIVPTGFTLACGNLLWFAFTGMETLLVLVLGLSTIHCAAKQKNSWMTIFVFLGVLTRPECVLIVPAIGLLRWREWRVWIQLLIAAGIGLLVTGLWNHHLTGTFLPSTLSGRRWIIGVSDSPTINPLEIAKNFFWLIGVWSYRLAEFTFGQKLFTAIGFPKPVSWTIAGVEMLVMGIGIVVSLRKRSFFLNALLIWAVFTLIGYAVMLPTRGHGGRYQPMILLIAMVFFVTGLMWLWNIFWKRQVWRVGVCVLAGISAFSLTTWFLILFQSLIHFDRVHITAAKWIDDNTSKNALVAGFDIGTLAYWSHRPIIDIGGLVDPAAGRALYNHTIPEYLKSQHAEYLVMIFPYTDPNIYFNDFRLDELERAGMLKQLKRFNLEITDKTSYWPGEAARVLANEIRIYKFIWNENQNKN